MKVDNKQIMSMPMRMHNQNNVSNVKSLKNQTPSLSKNNGNLKDIVELSMSGKNRGQRLTIPRGIRNTAGLVIKNLELGEDFGQEGSKPVEKEIVTVSNDKAGLGASENRLGGNTRSIDNPKEAMEFKYSDQAKIKEIVEEIRPAMLKDSVNTIMAQGNTNANAVLHLLK